MPTILRRMPFYENPTSLRIPGGPAIHVGQDQIIVWVSIAPTLPVTVSQSFRRFPALLDTGFNGTFLLREDQLDDWMNIKLDQEMLPYLRTVRIRGVPIPTFEADLWIYSNTPGFRDQLADAPPWRLELVGGIAVSPASKTEFHLPLLGMAAMQKNRLRLLVNGEKRYISLRTPFASPVAERGTT